jgi:hypothetical protein
MSKILSLSSSGNLHCWNLNKFCYLPDAVCSFWAIQPGGGACVWSGYTICCCCLNGCTNIGFASKNNLVTGGADGGVYADDRFGRRRYVVGQPWI